MGYFDGVDEEGREFFEGRFCTISFDVFVEEADVVGGAPAVAEGYVCTCCSVVFGGDGEFPG